MAQQMRVETPAGEIAVEEFGTYSEYPGITVFINGEQVVTVEYSHTTGKLQAAVWQDDYQNDPVANFEYPDLAQ